MWSSLAEAGVDGCPAVSQEDHLLLLRIGCTGSVAIPKEIRLASFGKTNDHIDVQ